MKSISFCLKIHHRHIPNTSFSKYQQLELPAVMKTNSNPHSLEWKTIEISNDLIAPPPRWGHSSCIVRDSLYIFGGFANSSYMNDIWEYSLNTLQWKQIKTYGDIPLHRSNSTLSFDPYNEQLLLFGGGGPNKQRFNTVSILDLNTLNWIEIPPSQSQASPWQRTYHIAEFKFPYLIVFGGEGADDLGDLWTYDVRSLKWQQIKINGDQPCARRFHSSCIVDNKMYIFGGCYGKYICLNDLYSLDIAPLLNQQQNKTLKWQKIDLSGEITQRWGHTSHFYGGDIYIFGGRSTDDMNDLLAINIETASIRKISTFNNPAARRRHGGGFIGSSLVLFGGFDGNYFDDLFHINLYQSKQSLKKTVPPNKNLAIELKQEYIMDEYQQKFYISTALIGKYFKNQNKMIAFLEEINRYYTPQQLTLIFQALYRGWGEFPLNSLHIHNLYLLPEKQPLSSSSLIHNFLQEGSEQSFHSQSSNMCVQLQPSMYRQYINKLQQHWQMINLVVLNQQHYFNCCFPLMKIHSQYFYYMLSQKYDINQGKISIQLPNYTPLIFEILLAYLHTNLLVVPAQSPYSLFIEIASLAEYFSLHTLMHICEQSLIKLVTISNYQQLISVSIMFSMESLQQNCSLKQLNQLSEIKQKQERFILTIEEEKCLQSKSKQLYYQLKFDLLHRTHQKAMNQCSGLPFSNSGKQNEKGNIPSRKNISKS